MNIWHHMRDNYTKGKNAMIKIMSMNVNKVSNYFNLINNHTIYDIIDKLRELYGLRLEGLDDPDEESENESEEDDSYESE